MATKTLDKGLGAGLTDSYALVAAEASKKHESQEVEIYRTRLRGSGAKEEKSTRAEDKSKATIHNSTTTGDDSIDRSYSIRRDASKTTESSKKDGNAQEDDTQHSGLIATLKALKFPMAFSTIAMAADRVMTYFALSHGFVEVNPLVAGAISTLSLTGGLVVSGVIVIGAVLATSFLIEHVPPLKGKIEKNSVARSLFYGIGGTELIVCLNNFLTLTHLYPAFNLLNVLGPVASIAVLGTVMFLPAVVSFARQLLNSRKESRGSKEYRNNGLLDVVGNPAATSLQV